MAEPTEAVRAVERVAEFPVPPDVLWEAITDPALLAEWFGPVGIDLTPGGAITNGEPDEPDPIGVVETVEAPNRLGFVWIAPGAGAPSSVELVIDTDDDGGSVLRVREVLIEPRWDARPAWFASSRLGAAGARA